MKEDFTKENGISSEIRILEDLLNKSAISSFGPFFKDKVMTALNSGKRSPDINQTLSAVFRPLGLAASGLLVALAIYNFSSTGDISLDALIGLPEITVEDMAAAIE